MLTDKFIYVTTLKDKCLLEDAGYVLFKNFSLGFYIFINNLSLKIPLGVKAVGSDTVYF